MVIFFFFLKKRLSSFERKLEGLKTKEILSSIFFWNKKSWFFLKRKKKASRFKKYIFLHLKKVFLARKKVCVAVRNIFQQKEIVKPMPNSYFPGTWIPFLKFLRKVFHTKKPHKHYVFNFISFRACKFLTFRIFNSTKEI